MAYVSREKLSALFDGIATDDKDVPIEKILLLFNKLGWQMSLLELQSVKENAKISGMDERSLNYERLLEWLYPSDEPCASDDSTSTEVPQQPSSGECSPQPPKCASVCFNAEEWDNDDFDYDNRRGSQGADGLTMEQMGESGMEEDPIALPPHQRMRARALTATKASRKLTFRDSMDIFGLDSFLMESFRSSMSGDLSGPPQRAGTMWNFELPAFKLPRKKPRSLSPRNLKWAAENDCNFGKWR
eukprot:TRINITY_DN37706_c0_g1_i1.p1 TRINITY_DN37706_c0_g1~~TRINITY_DN37706_c0_g1_i1.p1  ORF type:complete len:265 (-),score=65.93 TRINITY_DN37706_c0_g1_i1:11-742(-)